MSLLPTIGAVDQDTDFYNGVATQSLRFDYGSNPYLTINHGSTAPTLNTKGTVSFWVKRGVITSGTGNQQYIIHTGTGTSDSTHGSIHFETTDVLAMGGYSTTPFVGEIKLRDTASWYHILLAFDSTSSTASERYNKIYINGEEQNNISTNKAVDEDEQFPFINANQDIYIGKHASVNRPLDSYLAEFNIIDGQALTPSSFGETKNGVWIPKNPTGLTYGNNGFRLQFAQSGVGTASTSTIGADTSGNTNHFTSSGIVASDCNMPDSPENNFATLNVLDLRGTVTASEGSLKADIAVNGNITATIAPTSGKWYWEVYLNDYTNPYIGVQSVNTAGSGFSGYSQDAVALNNAGDIYYDASPQSSAFEGSPAWANTNIISVAYDVDNNKIWWALNGQFYTANASSESTIAYSVVEAGNSAYDLSSQVTHGVAFLGSSASNGIVTINFGQDASFAGGLTGGDIGDETDGNGNGLFKYAPPSGFLALCSANLPEPTIGPNSLTQADDYFNTLLYSGDGASTQNVTGVGFQPDWTWIKERSSTSGHVLADSSREYGNYLASNETIDEGTGVLNSASSDGFQTTNSGATNQSSQTYVAWNWLANGGTTSSNTDGSITSTVQANTTAGFSIVLYTGTGANATVGHGVQVNGVATAPRMIIMKNRDSDQNWVVYHEEIGNDREILLNTTGAQTNSNSVYFQSTSPTSTVFSLGSDNYANASTDGYVAYCFAEIEGYSKFGSYTGNAADDGTFVYLGFKPAWIMIKCSSATSTFTSWAMYDNKRKTFNDDVGDNSNPLYANQTAPEGERGNGTTDITGNAVALDFLSNGFKCRDNASEINASQTFVYMAFAEAPFKYANAE